MVLSINKNVLIVPDVWVARKQEARVAQIRIMYP